MRKILIGVFLLVLVIALMTPQVVFAGGKCKPPPPKPSVNVEVNPHIEVTGGKAEIGDITVEGSKASSKSCSKSESESKSEAIGIGSVNVETPRDFLGAMFMDNQSMQAFFNALGADGSSPLGITPLVVTRKMAQKNRLYHNPIGILNILPIVKRWIPPFYSYKKDLLVLHEKFDEKREKSDRIQLVVIPEGKRPLHFLLGKGYLPIWADKIEGEPGKDADKLLHTSLIPLMDKGMTYFTMTKGGSKEVAKSESDSLVLSGGAAENFTKNGIRGDIGAGLGDGRLRNELEHWWHVVGMVYVPELAEAMKELLEETQPAPPPSPPPLAEKKEEAPAKEFRVRVSVDPVEVNVTPIPLTVKKVALPEAVPPEVTIFFDWDSYEVLPEERLKIKRMAAWQKDHPDHKIQIEGHCSEPGSEEYNLGLGGKRGRAVAEIALEIFDREFDIPRDRVMPNMILQYVSLGESKIAFSGAKGKKQHRLNQRVIFRIVGPASGQ